MRAWRNDESCKIRTLPAIHVWKLIEMRCADASRLWAFSYAHSLFFVSWSHSNRRYYFRFLRLKSNRICNIFYLAIEHNNFWRSNSSSKSVGPSLVAMLFHRSYLCLTSLVIVMQRTIEQSGTRNELAPLRSWPFSVDLILCVLSSILYYFEFVFHIKPSINPQTLKSQLIVTWICVWVEYHSWNSDLKLCELQLKLYGPCSEHFYLDLHRRNDVSISLYIVIYCKILSYLKEFLKERQSKK